MGLLHFVFLFHSKAATKPTKPTVNVGCTTIKEDCAYEEYTLFGKCNSNNNEEYYSRVVGKVDSIVKEDKKELNEVILYLLLMVKLPYLRK